MKLPPQHQFQSKIMDDSQKLVSVFSQDANRIDSGIYNIAFDTKEKINLGQYKQQVNEMQNIIGNISIEECEDLLWDRLAARTNLKLPVPKYSIDNAVSLFPNGSHWNLNKFRYEDSIIHSVCFFISFFSVFSFLL